MLLASHPLRMVAYAGADGRALTWAITDGSGDAMDLTGYTVQISAKLGDTYKISRASCTIDEEASGLVSFTPSAQQIATPGAYDAQLRLINGSGLVDFTEPFIIDVINPVDDDS